MQIHQAFYGVVVTPQRALIHRAALRKETSMVSQMISGIAIFVPKTNLIHHFIIANEIFIWQVRCV